MRKLLFVFVLSFTFVVSNAQTEDMKFSGIPMNQTYSSFVDALKQKGFTDNVKQLVWDFPGYKFITLAGKFWQFDDCEIRVKYSATTDSIASVAVRKQFFSIWYKKVFELMDNLDLKYGERLRLRGDANNSEYRWFSREPYGMVEVNWLLMEEVGLDQFMIEYFTTEETKVVLKKQIKEKKAELDEL